MRKKLTGTAVCLLLILISGTALSQLSPPFRPLPSPTTTAIQKYSSEQLKLSFDYPGGWRVKEEQGTVDMENPQGFAWITIWRIAENVDPQTYLQNAENYLKEKWQSYTVTARSKVRINGIDACTMSLGNCDKKSSPPV